jgi:uncharacterized surface anchored protein
MSEEAGDLTITVRDNQGQSLEGVTGTLTGVQAPEVRATDDQGQATFAGLQPGTYQLVAQLEGFATFKYPNISIVADRNKVIDLTMVYDE